MTADTIKEQSNQVMPPRSGRPSFRKGQQLVPTGKVSVMRRPPWSTGPFRFDCLKTPQKIVDAGSLVAITGRVSAVQPKGHSGEREPYSFTSGRKPPLHPTL